MHRKQLTVFLVLLITYAFCAFATYAFFTDQLAPTAFGAGHLGTIMFLAQASSLADLSPVLLIEVFLLNGVIGLIAGNRHMKDGLVAAAGLHFWTDMVFHVLYGLF